jgi:YggT family protein
MFLYKVLDDLLRVYELIIIARAVVSWFSPGVDNPLWRVLVSITEPVMAPCRRIIPSLGGMDISPIVLILFIDIVIRGIVLRLLFYGIRF